MVWTVAPLWVQLDQFKKSFEAVPDCLAQNIIITAIAEMPLRN